MQASLVRVFTGHLVTQERERVGIDRKVHLNAVAAVDTGTGIADPLLCGQRCEDGIFIQILRRNKDAVPRAGHLNIPIDFFEEGVSLLPALLGNMRELFRKLAPGSAGERNLVIHLYENTS